MSAPEELIGRAVDWGQRRLLDCDRTSREGKNQRGRDWAYGESVAIRMMIHILQGGEAP